MTEFTFTKDINPAQLHREIEASTITIGLKGIVGDSTMTFRVVFKAPISAAEETTLNALVADHVKKPDLETPKEVITQYEKPNKTLRTIHAFGIANPSGIVRVQIPVPQPGRWMAYGDAEFETRAFGDIVSLIEISDLDRLIAWQLALASNPAATDPLSDQAVRDLGASVPGGPFPRYPILGHYDEKDLNQGAANKQGMMGGGMAMTFSFGVTEAQPVGGYGFAPGGMYLVIETKNIFVSKAMGVRCQFSVDWAETNQ